MADKPFNWEDYYKLPSQPPAAVGKAHGQSYSFNSCRHWRTPVQVGRYTVTCSSYVAQHINAPPTPDFGIYLAIGWSDKLGKSWTNGSYIKRLAVARPYPAMFWDWPDYGIIPLRELNTLVEICLTKMREGKKIDIGCHSAHGRSGSLLACLISRVEHLSGTQAIANTRRRYCGRSVETSSQEKLVVEYANQYKWGG